ncbi:MAG: response regulator transcription factor [Nitrosomonas sp.]|nr:response regulator transcription factor [Nitrosomonas sp.]
MSDETSISMIGPIKILLIEDNQRMQESLKNGFQGVDSNYQFVAETGNGKKALEILQTTKIDLVIMDYRLEEKDLWGVELTKYIVKQYPDIKIIFWSVNIRSVDVNKAKNAGAHGYMPKESRNIEIKVAIDKVMRGEEVWLDTNSSSNLTKTEIKVMEQLAKGKSNQKIAIALLRKKFLNKTKNEMGFADKYKTIDEYMDEVCDKTGTMRLESQTTTVQTHLVNIKRKCNGLSRGELIREAIDKYSELEDKRDISSEDVAVLELLHYAVKPELIAKTLAISERNVEKIRNKFNPEEIKTFLGASKNLDSPTLDRLGKITLS